MKRLSLLCCISILILMMFVTGAYANPINVASIGIATQSSTDYEGYANFGNDGNTNGNYGYSSGSVTHTGYEFQAWWQVDLLNIYKIEQIAIWNRTDYGSDRLSNFSVSILDSALSTVWSQSYYTGGGSPNPTLNISLNPTEGQFVKVQLNGSNWLTLAEVQVFANIDPKPVPEPSTLILMGIGLGSLGLLRRRRIGK